MAATTRVVEVAPERFDGWLARFEEANPVGPQRLLGVDRFDTTPIAVLLIRRGGYAVALVAQSVLVAHKVGSRHVQSRTAAGGWSQQRFARRRGNQADELVRAVRDHLVRVLGDTECAGLLVGGDRTLVGEVLEDPRLHGIRDLPRRELYDLPDPNRAVLDRAIERGRAVRVSISHGQP